MNNDKLTLCKDMASSTNGSGPEEYGKCYPTFNDDTRCVSTNEAVYISPSMIGVWLTDCFVLSRTSFLGSSGLLESFQCAAGMSECSIAH